MADLSVFSDESFDIVFFHPISNLYVPDVNPVWQECYRVLRKKKRSSYGEFYNPVVFVDDRNQALRAQVRINETDLSFCLIVIKIHYLQIFCKKKKIAKGDGLVFGHSLTDLIGGGQLRVGFYYKILLKILLLRLVF